MSEIDLVRREFVQLWGSMAAFWGISPTTAKVHSWLLSTPHSVDTNEIMEALDLIKRVSLFMNPMLPKRC